MNVIQNRNGHDRAYEFVSHDVIRITGESLFTRQLTGKGAKTTMVEMEGGPYFSLDSKFVLGSLKYDVLEIRQEPRSYIHSKPNMESFLLKVSVFTSK